MKIILSQDVYNLGEEGDVRVVANGYARNFLVPQKMAVLFNKQNAAVFESQRAAIEKRKEEKRAASAGLKEKIEAITLELKVSTGETGKLFGSVTNANIAEELKKAGVVVERKKIELPDHTIKMIGEFTARVKLYGSESADLKIIIKSDKVIKEKVKTEKPVVKEVVEEAAPQEKAKEAAHVEAEVEEAAPQEEAKEAASEEEAVEEAAPKEKVRKAAPKKKTKKAAPVEEVTETEVSDSADEA